MTDLCPQNTTKLLQAAHLSNEEKSELVKVHQEHLNTAQTKREFYRNLCNDCQKVLQTLDTDPLLNCETHRPCSLNATIHYSFDLHIPSNPLQLGLIYFKTHLHADNYTGQNKNNFFLWYLAYRILSELQR